MIQLLNAVVQQAQNIAHQGNLPAQASAIPGHAANFAKIVGPEMLDDVNKINGFVAEYQGDKADLQEAINDWGNGNDGARAKIVAYLTKLQQQTQAVTAVNNKAGQDLASFRQQFAGDEQALNLLIQQYQSQVAVTQANLQQQRQKLQSLQQQIEILRWNPLAWAAAELVHLISDSKTYEQDIAETGNQLSQLQQQFATLQMAGAVSQQLNNNMIVLSNSLQNLVNSVDIVDGQIQQLKDTASNNVSTTVGSILFKAYYAAFDGQVNDLSKFVNN